MKELKQELIVSGVFIGILLIFAVQDLGVSPLMLAIAILLAVVTLLTLYFMGKKKQRQ